MTLKLGPRVDHFNSSTSQSSWPIFSLNHFKNVLLYLVNNHFSFAWGFTDFNNILCASKEEQHQYCSKYTSMLGVSFRSTLTSRVPLPWCLPSYRDLGMPITFISNIYVTQHSMASSTIYLSTIDASSWYRFSTYHFNILMHCSIGYIYHKKREPHILISLTKWTIKWTMISKNK